MRKVAYLEKNNQNHAFFENELTLILYFHVRKLSRYSILGTYSEGRFTS